VKDERDEERNTMEDDVTECMLNMQMDLNPMHPSAASSPEAGKLGSGGANDERRWWWCSRTGKANKAIV